MWIIKTNYATIEEYIKKELDDILVNRKYFSDNHLPQTPHGDSPDDWVVTRPQIPPEASAPPSRRSPIPVNSSNSTRRYTSQPGTDQCSR